jgi:hypothetical protein
MCGSLESEVLLRSCHDYLCPNLQLPRPAPLFLSAYNRLEAGYRLQLVL